jgi:hypothetical protein
VIRVLRAALSLQRFCQAHRWRFCFIGGIAVQRWGEPRLTRDADLTLLTGFGAEREFIQPLLAKFSGRVEDATEFAMEHRVLLLRTRGGVDLDVSLAGIPFEESVVRRSSPFDFRPRIRLRTCSPEDLVVLKAFANREKDWLDVDGVLIRQRGKLDWRYILRHLRPLAELKDEPGIVERLKRLRADR